MDTGQMKELSKKFLKLGQKQAIFNGTAEKASSVHCRYCQLQATKTFIINLNITTCKEKVVVLLVHTVTASVFMY
jgi:hypothetical protein